MKVPILIETEEAKASPESWLCSQAAERWLSLEYGPIGIVHNLKDLDQLLLDVYDNGLDPSVFVVNTYGAKDLLPAIDERACEKPILFLRRRLFAGKSGYMEVFGQFLPTQTSVAISNMRPRLTAAWLYGGKTTNYMAKNLCERIRQFQIDEDFRQIESQPLDVC